MTVKRLKSYLISTLAALLIFSTEAFTQGLMRRSQSRSQVMRSMNPPVINSVGRIKGNEVRRSRIIPPQNQNQGSSEYYAPDYAYTPEAEPTVVADPEGKIEEF